jgi:thymidylate synthase (FAD)
MRMSKRRVKMRKDKNFKFVSDAPFLNLLSSTFTGKNPNSDLGVVTHIDVLDCGHVSYVSHMGSDLTVVNAARVSFNKESTWEKRKLYDRVAEEDEHIAEIVSLSRKDEKLINYLAKHQHWTPFAHPQITIRIKTPIFIRAQLGKHQVGLVMNEISRRYVTYEPEFYTPAWRTAPTDGAKQGSGEFMFQSQDEQNCKLLDFEYENVINMAMNCYNKMLESGVAPEQARSILPQSMYTEWWWTGSLYAFSRIYNQRIEMHSQWESREYAKAIGYIASSLFPISWKCLTDK